MSGLVKATFICLLILSLGACGKEDATAVDTAIAAHDVPPAVTDDTGAAESEVSVDPAEQMHGLFAEFFEEGLQYSPILATIMGRSEFNNRLPNFLNQEFRDEFHEYNLKYLGEIRDIDRESLSPADQVSYDIFIYQQEQSLESEQFPSYLLPLSQFFSIPNFIAQLGSGQSMQPFKTVLDYENWLGRVEDYLVISDQIITNLRSGMETGVVQPRVIMEAALPQLAAQLVDDVEQSVFWGPVTSMPEEFSVEDRERLIAAYRQALENELIPAYRRLHDFVRDEYIPNARESLGTTALPNGVAWYNYQLESQTTTDMTAEQIYEFGLEEVARIRAEMEDVSRQVGFEGSLEEFFAFLKANDEFYFTDEEELLQGFRDLQSKVNERLPALFDVFPKADYEVRAVEAFRAASQAGASYQGPAPDGSLPGIFYVNTHNLRAQPRYGMETLSLHEASPGHHFQTSIQQEIENMPMFRRMGGYTAFNEGWGLYAESLGRELGMFEEPYQYFGRLSAEMLRAMRLVLDTGLHAKGWTRQQGIDYMLANSDMAESDVIAEVERYIALPGQATTYKVGQRIFSQLRAEAEEQLGDDFDIRAFHRLVLTGGSMPMDVLAQRVRYWIAQHQADTQ